MPNQRIADEMYSHTTDVWKFVEFEWTTGGYVQRFGLCHPVVRPAGSLGQRSEPAAVRGCKHQMTLYTMHTERYYRERNAVAISYRKEKKLSCACSRTLRNNIFIQSRTRILGAEGPHCGPPMGGFADPGFK